MALPALRGCYRVPFTYGFSRLFRHEHVLTKGFGIRRLPPPEPTCVTAAVHRHYSSDQGREKQVKKVVVVGIPNPLTWFRTRVYYFLIRTYFDTEFSIEEFTEGAKQVCVLMLLLLIMTSVVTVMATMTTFPVFCPVGLLPCFQTPVWVSVRCFGRTCGQRREYGSLDDLDSPFILCLRQKHPVWTFPESKSIILDLFFWVVF